MIETKRLLLRHLKASDLSALERILGDAEVMEFSDSGPLGRDRVQAWLVDQMEGYDKQIGLGILAVIRKSDSDLIGCCGLTVFTDIGGVSETEVGYRLAREAWGNGYATEAACAVRDYAFSELNQARLVSLIEPSNKRSIRVAEKLGMHFEKEMMLEGYDYPDHLYAMSQAETDN
jgi:RimJ/RimL family protein N-acetyltransferase